MSIIFNQLRVSDRSDKLFINAHINESSYFDNLSIKKITICTEDQVSETSPTSYTSKFIYQETLQSSTTLNRELNMVLSIASFDEAFNNTNSQGEAIDSSKPIATQAYTDSDLSKHMFFVYVETENSIDECTPCELNSSINLGVTFDYNTIYNKAINFTRELADTCKVPDNFIDFILNMEALKLSIETEHYVPAIKYYNTILNNVDNNSISTVSKSCGCYG